MLQALWAYRGFIFGSIRNEFTSRFSRSALGLLWMLIQPLVQVATYALVLSNLFAARLQGVEGTHAYAYYLMAGTLAWSLFSEVLTRCLTVFIDNGNLLRKMSFPRITLPAIVTGSALLNNVILLFSILAVFLTMGQTISWNVLWLIPLMLLLLLMTLGLGLVLGVLNVFMRDVGHIVPVVLQIFYWFTPIVYPREILPEPYRGWLRYNPMDPLIGAYQEVLVYQRAPNFDGLWPLCPLTIVLLGFGFWLFRKASPELVDVL